MIILYIDIYFGRKVTFLKRIVYLHYLFLKRMFLLLNFNTIKKIFKHILKNFLFLLHIYLLILKIKYYTYKEFIMNFIMIKINTF